MKILRFIPVILSFLLLAAHFSRANLSILIIPTLLLPFLLFIKKAWVARVTQIALVFGAFEWIRSIFEYVNVRQQFGEDWTKLAIILSGVALFTLLSALIFQSRSMKDLYNIK